MTAAPAFLWALAGRPQHRSARDVDTASPCANCGAPTARPVAVRDAVGPNFDASTAVRGDSITMCEACAWAFAGKPPATLRMWTVVARTDMPARPSHPRCVLDLGPRVQLTNRADMRHVAATLADPPEGEWLVTVSTTGHKQVVPYAHTNTGTGRWTVRVEDHNVTSTPAAFTELLARAAALRAAGASARAIAAGVPDVTASVPELRAWTTHSAALAPYRDAPLLALIASFLIKDHVDDYACRYLPPH